MIDLHDGTTPNGHEATMTLADAGLPYRISPVEHLARRPVQARVPGRRAGAAAR